MVPEMVLSHFILGLSLGMVLGYFLLFTNSWDIESLEARGATASYNIKKNYLYVLLCYLYSILLVLFNLICKLIKTNHKMIRILFNNAQTS